jgi:hypothetical protein
MTESSWTAPVVDRPAGPERRPERVAMETLLDHHRATLLWKCGGLTGEQLAARAVPTSTMSLLGLVRHMSDVERVWFRRRIAAEPIEAIYWSDASPDGDFDDLDPAGAEAGLRDLRGRGRGCRAVLARRDYDDTFVARHGDGSEETIDVRTWCCT